MSKVNQAQKPTGGTGGGSRAAQRTVSTRASTTGTATESAEATGDGASEQEGEQGKECRNAEAAIKCLEEGGYIPKHEECDNFHALATCVLQLASTKKATLDKMREPLRAVACLLRHIGRTYDSKLNAQQSVPQDQPETVPIVQTI
jgi:hypothetical protein